MLISFSLKFDSFHSTRTEIQILDCARLTNNINNNKFDENKTNMTDIRHHIMLNVKNRWHKAENKRTQNVSSFFYFAETYGIIFCPFLYIHFNNSALHIRETKRSPFVVFCAAQVSFVLCVPFTKREYRRQRTHSHTYTIICVTAIQLRTFICIPSNSHFINC